MTAPTTSARVVVVGGGISGLAAAYRLRRLLGPSARLTVVEASAALGGKLSTRSLAGRPHDVGAEAFLVRRPEARALVDELGLAAELVHPTAVRALLRCAGRTAALPPRTLLGVPVGTDGLREVLSADGLARVHAEPAGASLEWDGTDVAVGPLVARRFGPEVAARLVDPLLGGVYAGRADTLGLRPTMPSLAAALDQLAAAGGPLSLSAAATAAWNPGGAAGTPVFGALRGGMSVLVDTLARAGGAQLRLGQPVLALARTAAGWQVQLGSSRAPSILDCDAVVLAVPPPSLRRLLTAVHPGAAASAGGIEVASSVIVSLALPSEVTLPQASGVLVADGEPLQLKAVTYTGSKWSHAGAAVLRASLGRHGEEAALQADDATLIDRVRSDLARLTGITATPVDALVTRWGGGLPQYSVGHLDRVAAIEAAVAALPGLAVAGAALHGIGIPACIATADAAAARLARYLQRADAAGADAHLSAGPGGPV